jgi:hypothetical protein
VLRLVALGLLLLALAAGPAAAGVASGGREVRVAGTCTAGAGAALRLEADDGELETRFRVTRARAGWWRLVVVHERRVAWRGSLRATASRRSFELRRVLPDLAGSDTVAVTAWGPGGATCRATATVTGR